MKKFVSGIIVGVLLFAGTTVFADTAKELIGKRVQGTFEVTFNGKKISDAAVIEGSTYLPVRSVSEAAGIDIVIEGKKINLTTDNNVKDVLGGIDVDDKNMTALENRISTLKEQILLDRQKLDSEKINTLPRLESRLLEMKDDQYSSALGPALTKQGIDNLEAQIAESKKYIQELQSKIEAAEAEIKELEAQLNSK